MRPDNGLGFALDLGEMVLSLKLPHRFCNRPVPEGGLRTSRLGDDFNPPIAAPLPGVGQLGRDRSPAISVAVTISGEVGGAACSSLAGVGGGSRNARRAQVCVVLAGVG